MVENRITLEDVINQAQHIPSIESVRAPIYSGKTYALKAFLAKQEGLVHVIDLKKGIDQVPSSQHRVNIVDNPEAINRVTWNQYWYKVLDPFVSAHISSLIILSRSNSIMYTRNPVNIDTQITSSLYKDQLTRALLELESKREGTLKLFEAIKDGAIYKVAEMRLALENPDTRPYSIHRSMEQLLASGLLLDVWPEGQALQGWKVHPLAVAAFAEEKVGI